jgi:hypothetical protein
MSETLLITKLSRFNRSKVTLRHLRREKKLTDCITQATQFMKWVWLISTILKKKKYYLKNAV